MNELGFTITGLLSVIILIISLIYEINRSGRKFKRDIKELKIGNKYKPTKSFFYRDNPFNPEYTCIVEITDIKLNYKDKIYVQYKQIEPEIQGEYFYSSFDRFMDFYKLIK